MNYQHFGMKHKPLPSYEEACSRPPHKWRNDFWLVCYAELRKGMRVWSAIFLLLFCLFGFAVMWPFVAAYFAVQP